jgi:hypothetical protein
VPVVFSEDARKLLRQVVALRGKQYEDAAEELIANRVAETQVEYEQEKKRAGSC